MKIVEHFEDDHSAKTFIRPEYIKLKDFVKKNKGKFNYLLVQKWDRFSRHLAKGLLMIETLKKLGVEVNCIENWIDYNSPDHIIMLSIYLSTSEAENSKISERTKSGTHQSLKEGRYVNRQPRGYVSGKDNLNRT